jgi:DNA-binding transcriptional regulator LsrR (DeoR family)
MRPSRERDQLLKAARLYFIDGLSQQQVAESLGTTRSNVSRILAAARRKGVVEIRLNEPTQRAYQLEDALARAYGPVEARVVANQPRQDVTAEAGRLAASWLLEALEPKQRVALSWGRTLHGMVQAVSPNSMPDVEIVPLVGGLSTSSRDAGNQELVRLLADRLGCTHWYLHAPALFQSPTALQALLREPAIATALDAARTADIACVGIGDAHTGSSSNILTGLALDGRERDRFEAAGPVGQICGRFFDADGEEIDSCVHDRILGVSLEDLQAIPSVLGIAVGTVKGPAIRAALAAKLVDAVVCDEAAAQAALSATSAR